MAKLLRIVDDITNALDNDGRFSISEYLLEIDSEFDTGEIIRILNESIHYVNTQKINNYVDLFDFVRSLVNKIVSLDQNCGRF